MKLKEFESAVVAAIKEGNYRVSSNYSDYVYIYLKLDESDENEISVTLHKDGSLSINVYAEKTSEMEDAFKTARVKKITDAIESKKQELASLEEELNNINNSDSE